MRFERTIAVLVLATGVICGGVDSAASPTGQAAPEGTAATPESEHAPSLKPKTEVGLVPWKPAELRPEHAVLAGLVGHFTTKVHLYSGPYVRMLDTEGTAEGKVLMGGPFVEVTHSEKRMKQPFEAMTIYGFDRATGKYTAAAIDNTSTALIHFVGTHDAEKKQIVMTSHFSDQKSRVLTIARTVTTFVDANTWTYDEFVSHAVGGEETHVVTITFKRP
jgi:hypothetical protein